MERNSGRRQTSGRHLDPAFIWPEIGTRRRTQTDIQQVSVEKDFRISRSDTRSAVLENIDDILIKRHRAVPSPTTGGTERRNQPNNDGETIQTRITKSSRSSVDIERRKIALEIEKKKQALMDEIMKQKIHILEMEKQVREAEILEVNVTKYTKSNNSHTDSLDFVSSSTFTDTSKVIKWINELPESISPQSFDTRNIETKENTDKKKDRTDIEILCETLMNVVKLKQNNEPVETRRFFERDFPIFDGNPADWPLFISQFQRISTACNYTNEEKMIKLQKCLRGEARNAVAGMLITPSNLDTVIQTLEMRFGRSDQIIETIIYKVAATHPVRENDLEGLIKFSNHLSCLVSTIQSLNCNNHLQNPQLLKDLVQKLPESLKFRWGEFMMKNRQADLGVFSEWLLELSNAASFVTSPKNLYRHRNKPREFAYTIQTNEEKCIFCRQNGHKIDKCRKFENEDIDSRWKFVTERKLCFSCLKGRHQTNKCQKKRICHIHGCKQGHHNLLHKDKPEETAQNSRNIPETLLAMGHGSKNILLRMVNVLLYGPQETIKTVALCDEAATVTLMDSSLVERLGVTGENVPLCVQWTNELQSSHPNSICFDVDISGVNKNARISKLTGVRSVKNLALPEQHISLEEIKKYSYLVDIPITEVKQRPMIIIGQDNIQLTVARKICEGPTGSPIATKTTLGWIVHGHAESKLQQKREFTFHICHQNTDNDLHDLVQNSFAIDSFGVSLPNQTTTNSEARALEIMKKTAKKVGDQFEIGLLWQNDNVVLPESKMIALQRLTCIERKMRKDEKYREEYCKKIESYVEKGYLRKLSREETQMEDSRCWYLPHFGVSTTNKPKLRLVMDAAAKSNGYSLNDHLLAGPDLLQSLVGVLIKFRQKKIAFCADIREMFHQIRIRPEDQHAQRVLWREGDTTRPVDVYEMQVMTFGATCSPSCAQFIKNLNARQQTNSEEILSAIIEKHYVDDYLDSKDTVNEALNTITEVSRIQKLGGFNLVNWISNSEEIMKALSENTNFCKDLNLDCHLNFQRVLGLWWNAKDDNFHFRVKIDPVLLSQNYRPTKRKILGTVMSIFDPLGLISIFTIRGRILLQDIWKKGIGWDEKIDHELYVSWQQWLNDLHEVISNLNIPRCYSPLIKEARKLEMHIFCDASKQAFATAAYLLVINKHEINVSLVFAKAKVAPIKPLSIPRLELMAAVMGSRVFVTLKKQLEIKITQSYLWTDSSTVMHWLRGDGKRLGQFEAHRIGEIQENTKVADWKWVPSHQNPADLATRSNEGNRNNIRKNIKFWLQGPEFLYNENKDQWPETKISFAKIEKTELPKDVVMVTISKNHGLPDIERYSDLDKLIRVTAWEFRFITNLKNKKDKKLDSERYREDMLTRRELQDAEICWIKQSQRESFLEDIENIQKEKQLRRQSRLKKLTPILKNSLLVLGGRTNFASFMSLTARNPYILHPKHRFTKLLIKHYHEIFGHQGVETVLNRLRQKFWIIDGRQAVNNCFRNCNKCKLRKSKPTTPLMGQLPPERLIPNVKPFTCIGVDYFGPLLVTVGRRREKRWGVLFICLTIRAIHLEVAHSLSTDSAIMALRRLIGRRGKPEVIFSDNGTNFRGAAEELKKAVEEFNKKELAEYVTKKAIEWRFIAPGAPHMGGLWERLIRSVKNTFSFILNGQNLKDELLLTLFSEVEYILNSRPLTHVSIDPNDPEALTPNHFLQGAQPNEATFFHCPDNGFLRKEWQKCQQITNSFWKRWVREYLPTLSRRTKWTDETDPIKEDEIVVVIDDNLHRNHWKLGRIVAAIPGKDGRVRVVDIKTINGVKRRPVNKVCRLKLEE